MLSLAICAAFLPAVQCSHPSENRIFDKVRTSIPWSLPNALAVSPDGQYIYAGEGGAMAVLDTLAPGGAGYTISAPREPISTFGARPAKILLDTGTSPGTDDDLLIICAGRSGLWVMDAHPPDSVYRAAVVDDSGNNDVNLQKNRRFCNDAVMFTIDGVEYLAACFARKNQSRLRIYDMASVRSVLANTPAGEWTGGEIQSLHQTKINKRPGMLTSTSGKVHNWGLTVGLDVDQESPTQATLYLALWHQGLTRVRVTAAAGGGIDVAPHEWGPVFGKASFYNLDPALTPEQREWYSNFMWRIDGEVFREEPPVFTDVAVQNFCGHYLYASLDTLGWVRFRLDQPLANPWGEAMAIDHHEGEPYPADVADHPFHEVQFRLHDFPNEEQDYTYPRQIRVVRSGDKAVLAVNGSCQSIVKRLEHRTEGQTFNFAANEFNGVPNEFFGSSCGRNGLVVGNGEHVYLYDLGCSGGVPTPICIPTGTLDPPDPGEEEPVAPFLEDRSESSGPEMEIVATATEGELWLFTQGREDTVKSFVTLDPPTVTPDGQRTRADRPGRECWKATYSVVNPDLLLFSSNDGGYPTNGFFATCGSTLLNFYSPDPMSGGDPRANNGIFMDHQGQWPVLTPGHEGEQFMLATGGNGRYALRLVKPGDPCGSPQVEPEFIDAWAIEPRKHRFGAFHRWFYQSLVNPEYDADVGRKMLFLSGTGSVEGILAIDRQEFENWIFDPQIDEYDMEFAPTGVVLEELNTEPEFDDVPDGPNQGDLTYRFLQEQRYPNSSELIKISGKTQAYVPRLIKVPELENGPADTWVLVAPCGYVDNGEEDLNSAGEQFESYANNPTWDAPDHVSDFDRLLLQFWNVNDPGGINPDATRTFVPDSELAMALYLDVREHAGRTYLFVADFGGRVHVYDVTDVLWDDSDPVKLVEVRDVIPSYTDNLPNCVWEVAVDRAQWSSGGADYDELYLYAAVERVGIEVFHFDPTCAPGNRLERVQVIQTPGNPRSSVIRDQGGDKTLILSDGEAGIRILEYGF